MAKISPTRARLYSVASKIPIDEVQVWWELQISSDVAGQAYAAGLTPQQAIEAAKLRIQDDKARVQDDKARLKQVRAERKALEARAANHNEEQSKFAPRLSDIKKGFRREVGRELTDRLKPFWDPKSTQFWATGWQIDEEGEERYSVLRVMDKSLDSIVIETFVDFEVKRLSKHVGLGEAVKSAIQHFAPDGKIELFMPAALLEDELVDLVAQHLDLLNHWSVNIGSSCYYRHDAGDTPQLQRVGEVLPESQAAIGIVEFLAMPLSAFGDYGLPTLSTEQGESLGHIERIGDQWYGYDGKRGFFGAADDFAGLIKGLPDLVQVVIGRGAAFYLTDELGVSASQLLEHFTLDGLTGLETNTSFLGLACSFSGVTGTAVTINQSAYIVIEVDGNFSVLGLGEYDDNDGEFSLLEEYESLNSLGDLCRLASTSIDTSGSTGWGVYEDVLLRHEAGFYVWLTGRTEGERWIYIFGLGLSDVEAIVSWGGNMMDVFVTTLTSDKSDVRGDERFEDGNPEDTYSMHHGLTLEKDKDEIIAALKKFGEESVIASL